MEGRLSRLLNRSKGVRPGGLHETMMRVNTSECRDNISEHIKKKKSVKRSKLSQTKPPSSAEGGAVGFVCLLHLYSIFINRSSDFLICWTHIFFQNGRSSCPRFHNCFHGETYFLLIKFKVGKKIRKINM